MNQPGFDAHLLLRRWVRQAAVDAGQADGVSSESAPEIRELKKKNADSNARSRS
jgi:transposase-like protein